MAPSDQEPTVEFGRFRMLMHRRELFADGVRVELGSRALEVLAVLIEGHGGLVSKDAILERVWPGSTVGENNLQVQISALRKALAGDRNLIRTVSGRGYRFIAPVSAVDATPAPSPATASPATTSPKTNLPLPVSELIGRATELDAASMLVERHRIVTVTGTGGIGKTRFSLELGRRLIRAFLDGVWLAELGALADPALVPDTIASALGLQPAGQHPLPSQIAAALRDRRLLLLLDNCEHLVGAVAQFAEAILYGAPGVSILATSREPLRAEGECIFRLPPLDVPPEDADGVEAIAAYGACRLFVARAGAINGGVALDRQGLDPQAPDLQSLDPRAPDPRALDPHIAGLIGTICRRLDGIPLAVELAAARAGTLGIEALAAHLDDSFRLLTGGRRTALPRHQTLRATFDWSYDLLTGPETTVLRRLTIFVGSFSLLAANAVAADAALPERDVIDCLAALVAKSLVTITTLDATPRYRLLETTRAYAGEKLAESGESESLARRHAGFFLELFESEAGWEAAPAAATARLGPDIDNLRGALEWTLRPAGDAAMGVALAAAALPLWNQLSLLDECRSWVVRALAALDRMAAPDPRREMLLQAALANAVLGTVGTVDAVGIAWRRALELAEELDDVDQKLRALYGLYLYQMRIGDYRSGLGFAHGFRAAAEQKGDPSDLLMGDRIVGVSMFWLGDPGGARAQIEHMLARSGELGSHWQAVRFGLDQRVAGLFHLSRVLWVQGYPDQAMRTAAAAVEEAAAVDHTTSLCFALADGACPVAAWFGDAAATARFAGMLSERAEKLGLGLWHAYGLAWRGWLADRQGELQAAIPLLEAAIAEFRATQFDLHFSMFLGSFAEMLARAGRVADGAAAIGEAVERAERTEERWCFPELLRIKGDITWRLGGPDAARVAGELYVRALDWARRQSSLSWELRIAMSLARLRLNEGRGAKARELLQSVFSRFTEGFSSADLAAAQALLDDLDRTEG
jgi:predicted ATPase/DNA-binding winged helix-turn-helix (wHTH) protein